MKPHDPALLPATNGILQEFADLLRVITLAGADHEITSPEARNVELRMTDETEPTGTSAVPGLSGGGE